MLPVNNQQVAQRTVSRTGELILQSKSLDELDHNMSAIFYSISQMDETVGPSALAEESVCADKPFCIQCRKRIREIHEMCSTMHRCRRQDGGRSRDAFQQRTAKRVGSEIQCMPHVQPRQAKHGIRHRTRLQCADFRCRHGSRHRHDNRICPYAGKAMKQALKPHFDNI